MTELRVRQLCVTKLCVCDKVACGRTVGDAEEAADGCMWERTKEKARTPHNDVGDAFPI